MDAASTASEKMVLEADGRGGIEPSMALVGSNAADGRDGIKPSVAFVGSDADLEAMGSTGRPESVVAVARGKDADEVRAGKEVDEVTDSVAVVDPDAIVLEGEATAEGSGRGTRRRT